MSNILKNFFNSKLMISKRDSPSERLCADIQKDYYDKEGRLRSCDGKGFLDKQLLINGKKYDVIPKSPTNESFKLVVEDESGTEVFDVKMLYGPHITAPDQHILYIEDFCRETPNRQGVGGEMANYIRELAENRGFTTIGAHVVAQPYLCKDAMDQEQLEKFYEEHLNGENVKFKPMENSDCVSSVDWKRQMSCTC